MSAQPDIPLIRLSRASLRYGDKIILNSLDWELWPGRHWAVRGRNGAGKSSFLRLLRGELRPFTEFSRPDPAISWGFEGKPDPSPLAVRPLSSLLSPEIQRHYARQGWNISGEEVLLSGFGDGFLPYSPPSREEKDAVYSLAARLGLTPLLTRPAPELSQGQMRLLLLARALIKQPRLLLLDEPCDGLDEAARKLFFTLLEETALQGVSLVCALHRGEDAPACLGHLLELEQGKLVFQGEFRQSPASPAARRRAPTPARTGQEKKGGVIFRLRRACVYLQGKVALRGLEWTVREGEQWLLSGPNGAGKSTLLRLLTGEEHVALGGALSWSGPDGRPKRRITLEERRRYTGYVSDRLRNDYHYDLKGLELILSGLQNSIGLYRAPEKTELAAARRWMRRLKVAAWAETRLEQMSEGIARRFFLARALAPRPRLLILDEPCSGLDSESREIFLRALRHALQEGVQIIFVSHSPGDLALAAPFITHELALKEGRILYSGPWRGLAAA